jgi:hypothetical protein
MLTRKQIGSAGEVQTAICQGHVSFRFALSNSICMSLIVPPVNTDIGLFHRLTGRRLALAWRTRKAPQTGRRRRVWRFAPSHAKPHNSHNQP